MQRRDFLQWMGLTTLLGGCSYFDGHVFNQCDQNALPIQLQQHPLMAKVLQGLDGQQMIDAHVHLIGVGDGNSGVWVNPAQYRWYKPKQFIQMLFYLNAACVDGYEDQDAAYVAYLRHLNQAMPAGHRMLLLAFDYAHDAKGQALKDDSAFYVPNRYAADLAAKYPQDFVWCASIHPYRPDALDELAWCAEQGARAIKWLPPAMGIDPSDEKCKAFYRALAKHQIPLLAHAGAEEAVRGVHQDSFGNPLLFRTCLDEGATLILAHCASHGESVDLDDPKKGILSNFELFTRLMDTPSYQQNLYADISAVTLLNREPDMLKTLLTRTDWHSRLLQGSDFPLPAVPPSTAVNYWKSKQLLSETEADFLKEVRYHNPLLFDLACKRLLRWQGHGFADNVFMSPLWQTH